LADADRAVTKVTTNLLDPLGASYAKYKDRSLIISSNRAWLQSDLDIARLPPLEHTVATNPPNLSCQNDVISCGAFVVLYCYFWVVWGRLPTVDDVTGSDHVALRLVMLDMLVTQKVRKPLLTASDEMMSVESAMVAEPLAVRVSDDALDAILAKEVMAHKDEAAQEIADM
jgi:hypothetical protein